MVERIRDVTVAEEIAAQAGTDETPELVLGEVVTPVIFAPQRPPLAASGYFPGTIGLNVPAVALNTSHVGIHGSGFARSVVRVNWIIIRNTTGGALNYSLRRLDSPFSGFTAVAAIPGYVNAGNPNAGGVFSLTKSDTVGRSGVFMAEFGLEAGENLTVLGPWILNDGALLVLNNTVNNPVRASFGYEHWHAIRQQPQG